MTSRVSKYTTIKQNCPLPKCKVCLVGKRYGLTARQMQVIALVCLGLDSDAMRLSLGCSIETVRRHLTMILNKTGMDDRLNLALWALHQGIGFGFADRQERNARRSKAA